MSAGRARAALPEILDRVTAGEELTITRHGRAVAVIVRPDTLRLRRADRALGDADRALGDAERLRQLLDRGRSTHLDDTPSLTAERADQLVEEVRQSRAAR